MECYIATKRSEVDKLKLKPALRTGEKVFTCYQRMIHYLSLTSSDYYICEVELKRSELRIINSFMAWPKDNRKVDGCFRLLDKNEFNNGKM
jgi:hypothetical protein